MSIRKFLPEIAVCLVGFAFFAVPVLAQSTTGDKAVPSEKTIADILQDRSEFSGFAKLAKAGGVLDTLGGKGPFTVFAPTQNALTSLTGVSLDLEKMETIVGYHVMSGAVPASKVAEMSEAKMLRGRVITIRSGNGGVELRGRNSASITGADIEASNGVIHSIDAVLRPSEPAANNDEIPSDETGKDEKGNPATSAAEKTAKAQSSSPGGPEAAEEALKGTVVPDFELEGLRASERTFSPADFGGKYVLLNLWATWCAPCLKKIPELRKARRKYSPKNLGILNVSFDESRSEATKLLDRRSMPGRHAFAGSGESGRTFWSALSRTSSSLRLPFMVLVGPEGKILDSITGTVLTGESTSPLLNMLQKHLSGRNSG